MADLGLKISNPGFNALKAADYQLLFNSSWPSVAVAYEASKDIVVNGAGAYDITFNHNLGFPPYTVGWITINGVNQDDFSLNTLKIDSNNIIAEYSPGFDDFLFTDQLGNVFPYTMTMSIKCYNIDLSKGKDYTFALPATGRTPYDKNFGLKVVKQNRNINSQDLRDFIIHTRGQSPAVLSVITQTSKVNNPTYANWYDINYTNPEGYVAWIYGYAVSTNIDGSTFYANISIGGTAGGSTPVLNINGATFTLSFAGPDTKVTLLVLRDPMFAPQTINVTY